MLRTTVFVIATFISGAALAHPAPSGAPSASANLQGDQSAWRDSPYMHQFYAALVAACSDGCARADVPALEAKARLIFADFAVSMHVKPQAMQAHLGGIPRQAVQIGTEDPKMLSSYESFWTAMVGPD